MNTDNDIKRGHVPSISAVLVAAVVGLAGCDFNVSNPGPVSDTFLDDAGAYAGIVGGVQRDMNSAFQQVGTENATRAREIHMGTALWWYNNLPAYNGTVRLSRSPWSNLQAARWAGEDGIRRLERVLGTEAQSNRIFAELHLWTAYATRALGEFYCNTVVDGGPAITSAATFRNAEALFTSAMTIGTAAGAADIATAAQAGRASVRVNLGEWTGAVQDATGIATDFEWVLLFQPNTGEFRANVFFLDQDGLTVWNTFYESYFTTTGDPRTPWLDTGETVNFPPLPGYINQTPRFKQQKYTSATSPVQFSSGQEMRLIQAEALLVAGSMAPAMVIVNRLRADAGMAPWPAPASMEEAWTNLRTERGIELWLEGRRLGDRRRWSANSTPGVLNPWELGTSTPESPDLSNMVLCAPIPESEWSNNDNVVDPN